MPYATDADLQAQRPDILQLGIADWSAQHQEATRIINRALATAWYPAAARSRGIDPHTTPFAPDRLLHADTQLTALATAKTLHLAYLSLAKGHPDEPYHHLANLWRDRYRDELADTLAAGLDYDWNASATIDPDEAATATPSPTLERL